MRKNVLIFGHNDATQFVDIYNQYTRTFDQNKYAVTVVYLTGAPSDDVRKRTLADEVIFLNTPKKNIRMLKIGAIRQILKLCKQKQFQIVICHRYKPSYIMLWVSLLQKIPALIFVMHELRTMASFNRRLLINLLKRKNMVLAGVSNAVRDDIKKNLPRLGQQEVVTLYNMMDIDLTLPKLLSLSKARALLKLDQQDFVFGNIARLVPNKDQTTLINAFAMIKPECPHAKLLIMGEGQSEAQLKKQAAGLGLTNDVIFTGFLPNGFQYMQAFDVFILTSIQEAFGRVLLEAMIAKLPIIATAVHGIPEVMGEMGYQVRPGDVQQIANQMKNLYTLSQKERVQCGEKAYQHVLKHFSIPAFKEQFWQLPLVKALEK